MNRETYDLWLTEEYPYPAACGFVPNVRTYVHEDSEKLPGMIVVPGGGYRMVSPTEGEIVAKRFYEAGFQAFVFTYTTNVAGLAVLKDQPLQDLSRAVRLVRKHADHFHLDETKVFVCGFSAGAHLAGSLAVHWKDAPDSNPAYADISNRPTGAILSYPVITSGQYAHRDSFVALCGENATEEELRYQSLETQVTKDTCPVFLWQTVTDETVPVENSFLMAKALKEAGVPMELHLFPEGMHGLSLANETWESRDFGEPYTMEQIRRIMIAGRNGELPLTKEKVAELYQQYGYLDPEHNPTGETKPGAGAAVPAVTVWPDLAVTWMRSICK